MKLGSTFSVPHFKYLKINLHDAVAAYRNLGLKYVRLGCYWSEIEKEKNRYSFNELVSVVNLFAKSGIKIIMTIGMKAPRYPEYYFPSWLYSQSLLNKNAVINSESSFSQDSLESIRKSVETLKKYSEIEIWQVENEPLDPSGKYNYSISPEFLEKEVELVRKIDKSRKILINFWANELLQRNLYQRCINFTDIIGFDLYLKVPVKTIAGITFFQGPKNNISRYVEIADSLRREGKEVWITELQAEPWEKNELVSRKGNPPSFRPVNFVTNLNYIKPLKPEVVLLWGFEYWLLRKLNNDNRYFQEAEKLILSENKHI